MSKKNNTIDPSELEKIELDIIKTNFKSYIKNQNIPNYKGIYFIFDKSNVLIYIGQSVDIDRRMQQHLEFSMWFEEFANRVACVEYEGNLDEIEMKYILKHNTRFNSQSLNYDDSYTQWNWFVRNQKEKQKKTLTEDEYYHIYPWEKPNSVIESKI